MSAEVPASCRALPALLTVVKSQQQGAINTQDRCPVFCAVVVNKDNAVAYVE